MPNPLLAPLMRWFGRLSYPKLFLLTAALFVGDVLVPDMIPFVDELLLGLGTLLLANWKRVRPGRGETIEGESGRRDRHHAGRQPLPPRRNRVRPRSRRLYRPGPGPRGRATTRARDPTLWLAETWPHLAWAQRPGHPPS